MKICKDCKIEKPLSDFYKDGKYYVARCKICHRLKFKPATGKPNLGRFKKGHISTHGFKKGKIPWNKGLRNTGFKPTNGFEKSHTLSACKRIIDPDVKASMTLKRIERGKGRDCINDQLWKKAVLERDNYECKKCFSREKLCIHHVKKWNEYPELRFDIDNGLTLCSSCHSILHHKGSKRVQAPWNKGKKMNADHCKKLSESHKGQVPWNKGIKLKEVHGNSE